MANYETPDSYGGTGPSSDCYKHANKIVVPKSRFAKLLEHGDTRPLRPVAER